MFSVLEISMVGMIVRLLRLLVRFIVLENFMIMKYVSIMNSVFSGIVICLNSGMYSVVFVGSCVVWNRN